MESQYRGVDIVDFIFDELNKRSKDISDVIDDGV
jgi:hypothetical protein